MDIARMFRHLCAEGTARRRFPASVLDAIQRAIAAGERSHRGQVCCAIEGALPFAELWRGRTPRARAADVFGRLRVWDTQHNSGVLLYVLLPDHAIEIVADRGIAAKVADESWKSICTQMQQRFAAGEFERGAVEGIAAVSELLAQHFPAGEGVRGNELSDRPVLL
jgi:uncharacterized membrane protein